MASSMKSTHSTRRPSRQQVALPLYKPAPSSVPGSPAYSSRRAYPRRRLPSRSDDCPEHIKSLSLTLAKTCILSEHKEPVPLFKGTDGAAFLRPQHPGYTLTLTPSSIALKAAFVSLFGEKQYKFRLSTMLNMSANGTGAVNSVIATTTVGSVAQFGSISALFTEFFLHRMHVSWQPVSAYNGPIGYLPATTVANLPIGAVSLQHAQPVYTSLTALSESNQITYANTGKPFSHTWTNIEKATSITQGPNNQSWSQVADVATYQGTVQFLSQPAPPALPASAVLGTFLVEYEVSFRNRS